MKLQALTPLSDGTVKGDRHGDPDKLAPTPDLCQIFYGFRKEIRVFAKQAHLHCAIVFFFGERHARMHID